MALNNVVFVSLTAFACSIAASMKELAKAFPDWIKLALFILNASKAS